MSKIVISGTLIQLGIDGADEHSIRINTPEDRYPIVIPVSKEQCLAMRDCLYCPVDITVAVVDNAPDAKSVSAIVLSPDPACPLSASWGLDIAGVGWGWFDFDGDMVETCDICGARIRSGWCSLEGTVNACAHHVNASALVAT